MGTLRAVVVWCAGVFLAGVALPAAAVVCGIGWLYLLRSTDLFAAGPGVRGALALKQLAFADAQPLMRVITAWVITGVAAGAVLDATAGRRARRLLPFFAVGSAILLLVVGAASDAIANNEALVARLAGQLSEPALAVALGALFPASLLGALCSLALRRRSRARTPKDAAAAGPGPPPRPACTRSTS
jgi:hypothetical protein